MTAINQMYSMLLVLITLLFCHDTQSYFNLNIIRPFISGRCSNDDQLLLKKYVNYAQNQNRVSSNDPITEITTKSLKKDSKVFKSLKTSLIRRAIKPLNQPTDESNPINIQPTNPMNASYHSSDINRSMPNLNKVNTGMIDTSNNKNTINHSNSHDSKKNAKSNMFEYRLYNIEVLLENDPGKDFLGIHEGLHKAIRAFLKIREGVHLDSRNLTIVQKSFDARYKRSKQPKFVYTVDLRINHMTNHRWKMKIIPGRIDHISAMIPTISSEKMKLPLVPPSEAQNHKIIVVGAGPAGLFAALTLVKFGFIPIILERGRGVEARGRDIGALFNRKILNSESNLCYGEGGAGTWSDGKLTTQIGKHSQPVRTVLQSLVYFGAPERILIDGKPHLGTDRLVRILKNLRNFLESKGVQFYFDHKVDDVVMDQNRTIRGVVLSNGTLITANDVILAVGHSARTLYERLISHGVTLEPKSIAVGFRVEHPQELINRIQYGPFCQWAEFHPKIQNETDNETVTVAKVPVADYKLTTKVNVTDYNADSTLPTERSCYSFCMCPGGQIVPTSVNESELCINGMSFSKRQSKWANSALVVNVTPEDMERLDGNKSPLRGVEWQREMERRAATLGGGNLVAPVQRITDFLNDYCPSDEEEVRPKVSSSYRMGVKEAPLHELYPEFVTNALKAALIQFDKQMPGFITSEGVLHGVETRTSAPVQIVRHNVTCECIEVNGLYPTGEGAGYAGGIVSAAVDGIRVAESIIQKKSNVKLEYTSVIEKKSLNSY